MGAVSAEPEPIACSLTSDGLSDRRGQWEAIDAERVAAIDGDAGFEVRYRRTEPVAQLLPGLARAEADCCSFADWSVTDEGDTMTLHVGATGDGLAALRHEFGL